MKSLNKFIAESAPKGSSFDGEDTISMDAWKHFEKKFKDKFPTMFFKEQNIYMIFDKEGFPMTADHIGTFVPKTGKLFFDTEFLKKEDFYLK